MDEKVMAFATLKAAQDAADWAYWSMLGTWLSAIATFLAACVALWAIKGWREHEEALELREFRIKGYYYVISLMRAPEINKKSLSELEFLAVQQTFNTLNEFYLTTVKMHSYDTREKASVIYNKIADIQNEYIDGKITSGEAEEKVADIRLKEPLFGIAKG